MNQVPRSFCLLPFFLLLAPSGCSTDGTVAPIVGETGGDAGDTCLGLTCGHGVCAVSAGQPLCVCADGYHAQQLTCAPNDVNNPCAGVTCSGHGACAASSGKPLCACDPGYHASGSTTCMPNDGNDPCAGVTCSGRGVCAVVGGTTPTCVCNTGYIASGTNCVLGGSGGGELTLLAGAIGAGGPADGAPGTARFVSPTAVVANGATLYVAEAAGVIRKVDAAGVVSTLAGLTGLGEENQGYVNDTGAMARFAGLYPASIAVDASGNVFVMDTRNCALRKVTPAGVVTTLAGALPDANVAPVCADSALPPSDGQGNAVKFPNSTYGLTIDAAGNLYTRQGQGDTAFIRKITPAGVVSTIQLTNVPNSYLRDMRFSVSADGTTMDLVVPKYSNWIATLGTVAMSTGVFTSLGVNAATHLHDFDSVCVDRSSGTRYLANGYFRSSGGYYLLSSWITKLNGTTAVDVASTEAGLDGYVDAVGDAARFGGGLSLFCDDAKGRLLVADSANNVIRAVDTTSRAVTTVSGIGATTGTAVDGTGAAARFSMPSHIVADSSGAWYLTDTTAHAIRKVTAAGVVTTFAGLLGAPGTADGTGGAARFNQPKGLTIDSSDNLYVGEMGSIRKVTPAGVVTTLTSAVGTAHPVNSLAVDSTSGTLFFPSGDLGATLNNHNLLRVSTAGGDPVAVISNSASGITQMGQPVIDSTRRRLYIPRHGGVLGCHDLSDPMAVPLPSCFGVSLPNFSKLSSETLVGQMALGPSGTLYVLLADSTLHKVLTVAPWTTSLVASAPGSQGVELGPLPARLFHPMGLAVNPVSGQLGIISDQDGALLVTTGFTP